MSEFASLEELAGEIPLESLEQIETVSAPVQPNPISQKLLQIITMETGEGSIESYIDHPLNYKKNKGIAQILRGLTGIVGNLKLAIIDIGLGAFNINAKGQDNNARIYNDNQGYGSN